VSAARRGIAPMKATAGALPPDDDRWAYEIKWDGYRTLAFLEGGSLRLQSSNLLDVTARWPELAGLAAHINAGSAVLDGEVVAHDESGRPRFELLQRGAVPVSYLLFDVLAINGTDVTALPYEQRRHLLEQLVEPGPSWSVPGHQVGGGAALLAATADRQLEGIVAKRLGSRYQPGKRSPDWRKIKHRADQELVVGGWRPGRGSRAGTFGALLLGYYDDRGALRFAGSVGSGFDERTLAALSPWLRAHHRAECPFAPAPPRAYAADAAWVAPELVVQVSFTEWVSCATPCSWAFATTSRRST
jgi:bifunctional non-homologous end joining protein LigD